MVLWLKHRILGSPQIFARHGTAWDNAVAGQPNDDGVLRTGYFLHNLLEIVQICPDLVMNLIDVTTEPPSLHKRRPEIAIGFGSRPHGAAISKSQWCRPGGRAQGYQEAVAAGLRA